MIRLSLFSLSLWVACISALAPPQPSSRRTFVHATTTASLAAILAASPAAAIAAASEEPVMGAKAPEFVLNNSRDEGVTTLSQLVKSKKWTVLYFYPGAFTQGKSCNFFFE